MTNTRIDFKLNGRNLRTDLINITILVSFLTVCVVVKLFCNTTT